MCDDSTGTFWHLSVRNIILLDALLRTKAFRALFCTRLSLCTTPRRTTPPHVATAPRVASSLTRRSPHPAAPTPSGPEVTLWWRRAHAHNLCMLSYSIATRLHVGREAAIAAAAAAIAAATVVAGIAHHFADHHPAEEAHAGAHRHRAAGMVAAVVVPRVSGV